MSEVDGQWEVGRGYDDGNGSGAKNTEIIGKWNGGP